MRIVYIGRQELMRGDGMRLFNLHLPDGRIPTFGVRPGEDLKERMAEVQRRFLKEKAA